MSKTMRIMWLITIAFFVSGCSSFGVVYGPGGDELPAQMKWTDVVESGEKVRVTLEGDRTIEGKVVNLSADSLAVATKIRTVDTTDNIDEYEQDHFYSPTKTEIVTLAAGDDIRSVELPRFSWGKTLILVGAIAGPIVLMLAASDLDEIQHTGFE